MLVRLLVLIALAFSLGDLRETTEVVDQISFLEVELESGVDPIVVEYSIACALPRQLGGHAENLSFPAWLMDANGVFRPPRVRTA